MSLNFGKANRSIAFDPTSAFPLDARSYFESLAAAEAAAASAKEVGSTDSVYYYGQIVSVVENNKATLYIIQPDQTLSSFENISIEVNPNQFVFEEGVLNLKGFSTAEQGQILTINSLGQLSWINPIDTYTKYEIDERLASLGHLKRIITTLEELENTYLFAEDSDQYIFMIPNGLENDDDKYDEYIILESIDSEGLKIKYIEKVGSWEVNLNDYAKSAEVEQNYVKKENNARLITLDEINQFSQSERNIVNSVSNEFQLDLTRQLSIKQIPINKITDLEEILNNKITKQPGYGLISNQDQEKLDLLRINDDNNLEISTTVYAEDVKDLAEWITQRASTLTGLSENNLSDKLYEQLTQALDIRSINSSELTLTTGKLELNKVPLSKVQSLEEVLDSKASSLDVENLQYSMSAFQTKLNNSVTKIESLEDSLTWKEL